MATGLVLDEGEAHYLGHVLRLKPGDRLVVFNGNGTERDASVDSLQRRGAMLTLAAARAPLPESSLDLTLDPGAAEIRRDGSDRAESHGARRAHARTRLHGVQRRQARHRAQRAAHRSLAQDRAAAPASNAAGIRPPRIELAAPLAEAIEALPAAPRKRLALDPSAERSLEGAAPVSGLIVAVGPEGGFGATDWRRLDAAQFAPRDARPTRPTRRDGGARRLRDRTGALGRFATLAAHPL